jgi:hypothetical protein
MSSGFHSPVHFGSEEELQMGVLLCLSGILLVGLFQSGILLAEDLTGAALL